MAVMNDQVAVFLRLRNAKLEAIAVDDASVAHLAAGLCVERRAIEDDLDWFATAHLCQLVEQMVLRDDAANFGGRLGRFVTDELRDL